MQNPYVMNMIVKERQAEIRRKAALQQRLERADEEYRMWFVERTAWTMLSLVLSVSLLGISILM